MPRPSLRGVLAVEMLPARLGDALLVEWGRGGTRRHLLVDGGPPGSGRMLAERLASVPRLELLVVTHIDSDHIAGVLALLRSATPRPVIGDVWFNGWPQLPADGEEDVEERGPRQGERLGALLAGRLLPWNVAFGGAAVAVPAAGPLPALTFPGGLTVTVLGPGRAQLAALRPEWDTVIRRAGLVPGFPPEPEPALRRRALPPSMDVDALADLVSSPDDSLSNGASITLLLEHAGRSVLLLGDAHAEVARGGVDRLLRQRRLNRLRVDAVKAAHHGSRANVDTALLDRLASPRWLFSSNGSRFGHPDPEAVAQTVVRGNAGRPVELVFNYATPWTQPWAASDGRGRYTARYPDAAGAGVRVEL